MKTSDIIMLTLVFGLIYLMLTFLINLTFIGNIKFRINLPKPKRFEGRETPIYKLTQFSISNNLYTIRKYKLKHVDLCDCGEMVWYHFIPFGTIFQPYRYVECDYRKRIEITDEELVNFNVSSEYEKHYSEDLKQWEMEDLEENRHSNLMNKINEQFNKNYIK